MTDPERAASDKLSNWRDFALIGVGVNGGYVFDAILAGGFGSIRIVNGVLFVACCLAVGWFDLKESHV